MFLNEIKAVRNLKVGSFLFFAIIKIHIWIPGRIYFEDSDDIFYDI